MDDNRLVRTVKVALRPRESRKPTLPYKNKELFQEIIPVQKLVLIARDEELESERPVPAVPHGFEEDRDEGPKEVLRAFAVLRTDNCDVASGPFDLEEPAEVSEYTREYEKHTSRNQSMCDDVMSLNFFLEMKSLSSLLLLPFSCTSSTSMLSPP